MVSAAGVTPLRLVVLYELCLPLKRTRANPGQGWGRGLVYLGMVIWTNSSLRPRASVVWGHLENQGQDPCFPERETEAERRGAADAVWPRAGGPSLLWRLVHDGLTRLMLDAEWENLPFPLLLETSIVAYDGGQPASEGLSSV